MIDIWARLVNMLAMAEPGNVLRGVRVVRGQNPSKLLVQLLVRKLELVGWLLKGARLQAEIKSSNATIWSGTNLSQAGFKPTLEAIHPPSPRQYSRVTRSKPSCRMLDILMSHSEHDAVCSRDHHRPLFAFDHTRGSGAAWL
jgi:hypothetical protein